MPKGKIAPVPCPRCQGDMWDNSDMKKPGSRAPDYSCKKGKDACGGGVWLSDTQRSAAAQAPTPGKAGTQAGRPPLVLDKMLKACIQSVVEIFKDGKATEVADELIEKYAGLLFNARCRNEGILETEKKALAELQKEAAQKAAVALAETRKKEAAERERQASLPQVGPGAGGDWPSPDGMYEDDNSLPF